MTMAVMVMMTMPILILTLCFVQMMISKGDVRHCSVCAGAGDIEDLIGDLTPTVLLGSEAWEDYRAASASQTGAGITAAELYMAELGIPAAAEPPQQLRGEPCGTDEQQQQQHQQRIPQVDGASDSVPGDCGEAGLVTPDAAEAAGGLRPLPTAAADRSSAGHGSWRALLASRQLAVANACKGRKRPAPLDLERETLSIPQVDGAADDEVNILLEAPSLPLMCACRLASASCFETLEVSDQHFFIILP